MSLLLILLLAGLAAVAVLRMSAHKQQFDDTLADYGIVDPGNGQALQNNTDGILGLNIGAGSETNTMANPSKSFIWLIIVCRNNGGGTRTITFASAINVTGNTHAAFNATQQTLQLCSVPLGTGFVWEVMGNDSVTLS